jgi:hypothetical protein
VKYTSEKVKESSRSEADVDTDGAGPKSQKELPEEPRVGTTRIPQIND